MILRCFSEKTRNNGVVYILQLFRLIRLAIILESNNQVKFVRFNIGVHNFATVLTLEWRNDANKLTLADYEDKTLHK